MSQPLATTPAQSKVALRHIVVFVVLAYALFWLISLPLWLDPQGLAAPYARPLMAAGMFSPALAAAAVTLLQRRSLLDGLGLRSSSGVRRIITMSLAGVVIVIVVVALSWLLAGYLGVGRFDLSMPGADLLLAGVPADKLPAGMTPQTAFWVQLGSGLVAGATINAVFGAGEEMGWRGWFVPALLPLGRVPAMVIAGVVWGGWHAPIMLLGYNYPGAPRPLAMGLMLIFTTLFGTLLAWLRIRSDSIVPAAIAHGVLNAIVGFTFVFAAGGDLDWALASPMGMIGFIVLLPVAAALLRQQWTALPRIGVDPRPTTSTGAAQG
ncbi:MAG: CPBP family intramembrane metalloprotease [Propionibacteriales bacterium]|nr:CPBP family intramembrane metalloprotease [Propionibacteriales bacterium]